MDRKRKLASAIAGAILAYMKLEEEAKAKRLAHSKMGVSSLWGISARRDTMQLKQLYQMRFLKK